ncbi:MAG: response regulator [Candidatus Cloacimonadota bacterium]|nr:response regulator [Candidatus Cloacimonadota bacterium]
MSKILTVDDEKMITDIIQELLERQEHEVFIANSVKDAIELVRKTSFDLFITDISMPEMDGYQFIEEIKKIQPLAVIIVLTGYSSIDGAIRAVKLGAFKYITKPIKAKNLYKVVEEGLKKSKMDFSPLGDDSNPEKIGIQESEPIMIKRFSPEQKIDFYDLAIHKEYKLNDSIDTRQLEKGAIYLVDAGEISIWLNNKRIDQLRKYDTWGEETFLMAGKISVKMRADSEVQLLIFERNTLLHFFADQEETLLKRFIFNLSSAIFNKYRKAAQKIMMMQIGKD